MSARPNAAFCPLRRRLRAMAAVTGLRAVFFVATAVLAAAAHAGISIEEELGRLEPLAVREPVAATHQLDRLLGGRNDLSEHAQLHGDVIRLVIADAQRRSHDVLALSDRIHDRLRALGDARLLMMSARTRFGAFYELGHNDEAWAAQEDELSQAKRTGDDDLIAQALVDRAGYLIKQSDFEPAAAVIAEAEHRAQSPQEKAEVAYSNGLLARAVGDWTLALSAFGSAFEKFTALGDRTGQADSRSRMGEALHELGRSTEALDPLMEAERDYRAVDDKLGAAGVVRLLALVNADLNDPNEALRLNANAIASMLTLDVPESLARARLERAALLVSQRRAVEAQNLVDAASGVAANQDDLQLVALFYRTAAQTHALLGKFRDAYEEMAQVQLAEQRHTAQLVAHQLAAQRGRLESERLSRENALLRTQASSTQNALAEATRAARLQNIALGLGAMVVLGALIAIAHQRRLTRRIARMAETDALTGMLNRRHILEMGHRMMQRCRRDGRPCAMLMLDVDRFKEINDRFGHLAGDKALRAVARALGSCLRPGDQIGRYGGEEFAMILPGADAREAGIVAERLRAAVAQLTPDWAAGAEPLTVSGGIAIFSGEPQEFDELILRADRALYRAKDGGRNRMEYDLPGPVRAEALAA